MIVLPSCLINNFLAGGSKIYLPKKRKIHLIRFYREKTMNQKLEKKLVQNAENNYTIGRNYNSTDEIPIANRPIISVKSLTKTVINSRWRRLLKGRKKEEAYFKILDKVDLRIFRRERIAIVGKNGSGKTTLVKIISGFRKPTKGYVEYNFNYETSPYEKISIQFQDNSFLDQFRVREIHRLMIENAGGKIDNNEVEKLRKILNIDSLLDKKFRHLSGGQKQKIALFLSLICKPELLILDEFSTGLDVHSKNSIREYLIDYLDKHDVAFILICHEPKEIFRLCNKIIVLDGGKVTQVITDIQKQFRTEDSLEEFILTLEDTK